MKHAKGIITYVVLTFGVSWTAWEILLRLGIPTNSPMFQLVLLPGAFVPALAAIVVRKWITREGFADAGLRLNLRHWRHYLVAWLLPLVVVAAIAGLAVLLGVAVPDFTLQRAIETLGQENVRTLGLPPGALWPLLLVQGLIGSLIASLVLWGEEFGWRGYLQVRLLADQPLAAAVATGLIWGVWHYPVLLRGYNFPDHPYLGLLVFPVGTVLLSIILGWLRLRTGSVWAPSLCHAAFNAMAGSFSILLFAGGANWLYVNPLGLLGWVPLGALCAWIALTGQLRVRAPCAPAVPMAEAGELA